MTTTRQELLTRIDLFVARHELSERQFGLDVAGDHKFLARLRSGAGITLTVIEKAEAYMAQRDRAAGRAA